jgi:N-sulfoglucosamine sulfohydrolase
VDLMPTLIQLAGGDPAQHPYDGTSFSAVLLGESNMHRTFAYGVHNNIPEGPAYPIRSITDGRHHYIRNLLPGELYIEKHLMGIRGNGSLNNPYWATWVRDSWANPQTHKLVKRYMRRPAEELYDLTADRYEMNNLATDPALKATREVLSSELDRWLESQADPGAAQDTHKAHQAARKGNHLYGPGLKPK